MMLFVLKIFTNTSKAIHKSAIIYTQAKKIFSLSELLIPFILKTIRPPARRTNRPAHKRQTTYPLSYGQLLIYRHSIFFYPSLLSSKKSTPIWCGLFVFKCGVRSPRPTGVRLFMIGTNVTVGFMRRCAIAARAGQGSGPYDGRSGWFYSRY